MLPDDYMIELRKFSNSIENLDDWVDRVIEENNINDVVTEVSKELSQKLEETRRLIEELEAEFARIIYGQG